MNRFRASLLALSFGLTLGLPVLSSAVTFHVTQDLSALTNFSFFAAEFTLTGGSAAPNSTSSVTITNLSFSGFINLGSNYSGDVTAVANGFRLADGPTSGYGDAYVNLIRGFGAASVSFDFEADSTSDFATDPDYFTYRLLDLNGGIPTTGPFGDGYLGLNLDRTNTAIEIYDDRSGYRLPSVVVTPIVPPAVPAPPAFAAMGVGALSLLRRKRRA